MFCTSRSGALPVDHNGNICSLIDMTHSHGTKCIDDPGSGSELSLREWRTRFRDGGRYLRVILGWAFMLVRWGHVSS